MSAEHGLDTHSAAQIIGCSQAVLYRLRKTGAGPRFYRIGKRLVRYSRADVDA